MEATTGFEPVNRGFAGRPVASAGVRGVRNHARTGHLFVSNVRSCALLLLPALLPATVKARSARTSWPGGGNRDRKSGTVAGVRVMPRWIDEEARLHHPRSVAEPLWCTAGELSRHRLFVSGTARPIGQSAVC